MFKFLCASLLTMGLSSSALIGATQNQVTFVPQGGTATLTFQSNSQSKSVTFSSSSNQNVDNNSTVTGSFKSNAGRSYTCSYGAITQGMTLYIYEYRPSLPNGMYGTWSCEISTTSSRSKL